MTRSITQANRGRAAGPISVPDQASASTPSVLGYYAVNGAAMQLPAPPVTLPSPPPADDDAPTPGM